MVSKFACQAMGGAIKKTTIPPIRGIIGLLSQLHTAQLRGTGG
jgi:hypothetical protein